LQKQSTDRQIVINKFGFLGHSNLNDLADLIASIGDDEEILTESVQSAVGDLSKLVFGNDNVSVAVSKEGIPEEADTMFVC
jgi:hypothetical protein